MAATGQIVIPAIGGLGIFLLGMIVLTEGLRSLAGNAMRRVLVRFTRNPLSGVMTGAATTAMLQSSSATTVATVGFVSAGLITFPAAVGIILGANIGTTATGWLVALLGLKLHLGTVVLPLIFVGASLKLFASGRLAQIGYAIAGFSLIFVGITLMQEAMSGVQGMLDPVRWPADSLLGRLQLVLLGIVFTAITQSSSAGVAITLAALSVQAIAFAQGAALVIGMDVGTTITAVLATVGGSVNARRTGFSHVMYNLYSATLALTVLTPYIWLWETFAPGALNQNAAVALVAFHTSFNILSVLTILPFTRQFARFMQQLIPGTLPTYTDKLDESLLAAPELALRAVQLALQAEFISVLRHLEAILGAPSGRRAELTELQTALDETHTYLDRIQLTRTHTPHWEQLMGLFHALDHLQRLHERCEEEEDRASTAQATAELAEDCGVLMLCIHHVIQALETQDWVAAAEQARDTGKQIHQNVRPYREATMAQIASSQIDVLTGTARLEAIRWLRRVSKHIMRITQHMSESMLALGK